MKPAETSLDRLHDIVEPPPIPWWPPAPGWYVVIAVAVILIVWTSMRWLSAWKASAYRRAALKELARLNDAASIAELLRRTALAVHARDEIASLTGDRWVEWISVRCETSMPADVKLCLSRGIYCHTEASDATPELVDYAADWIAHHTTNEQGKTC